MIVEGAATARSADTESDYFIRKIGKNIKVEFSRSNRFSSPKPENLIKGDDKEQFLSVAKTFSCYFLISSVTAVTAAVKPHAIIFQFPLNLLFPSSSVFG